MKSVKVQVRTPTPPARPHKDLDVAAVEMIWSPIRASAMKVLNPIKHEVAGTPWEPLA